MKRYDAVVLKEKMRCIQQRGEWKLLQGDTLLVVVYRGYVYWSQQRRKKVRGMLF